MAFDVDVQVLDDVEPATVDDIVEEIIDRALVIARDEMEAIWPVGPPRPPRGADPGSPPRPHSRTLFRIQDRAVINEADYSQHVHYKGDRTPIVDRDARAVAEESMTTATVELETAIGDKLDGAVYEILNRILES